MLMIVSISILDPDPEERQSETWNWKLLARPMYVGTLPVAHVLHDGGFPINRAPAAKVFELPVRLCYYVLRAYCQLHKLSTSEVDVK